MENTLRQRIIQIKEICKKQGLKVPNVADIISESGDYVSERTLYNLLRDGSENGNFNSNSVIPVYEALIGRFGDMGDIQDIETLKRLLAERDKHIDRIAMQAERIEEEFESRERIYADRKKAFEHTITILQEQIDYLRSQIAIKDAEIQKKNDVIQQFINIMMKD